MTHAQPPRYGLGLRPPHYRDILDAAAAPVDFVEVISENFMVAGGRPLAMIEAVRARCPVALHGVSMSIGSADGVDRGYLRRLKALVRRIEPLWVSDHLCWTGVDGFNSHDLLPLPYTREALAVASENIRIAQDVLGRTLLVENPSSYVTFAESEMSEAAFLAELCACTGCDLLLDVNNVFVSAANHGFDPVAYLDSVPAGRVRQMHLAGHSQGAELLIDTHDAPVSPGVWTLYEQARRRFPDAAVCLERDDRIPPLAVLLAELDVARRIEAGIAA